MATTFADPSVGSAPSGGDPGSSAGSGDIGEFISSAYDQAESQSASTGDEFPEESGDLTGLPAEESANPADAVASDAQIDPNAPPSDPYPLSPDGKSYLVPKAELAEIRAARDFHQQVSQIFSSPQEAASSAQQASYFRQMQNDWFYGSPESVGGVLQYLAGAHASDPSMRLRAQTAFGQMAQQLPSFLSQVNPQAAQALSSSVISGAIEAAYQKAAQTGDPGDLQIAQSLEWAVSGGTKYRTELPQVNPADAARSQWERQKADFDRRQEIALKRDTDSFFQGSVQQAKYSQLDARLDKILAEVKPRFSQTAFEDLKAGIRAEVGQKLQSDPLSSEWWNEHHQGLASLVQDYRYSWQQGSPGRGLESRTQALVNDFVSRAMRVLPAIASKRTAGATQAVRAGAGPSQRASKPPGQNGRTNGAPAQNGAPPPNGRPSQDEWLSQWNSLFK